MIKNYHQASPKLDMMIKIYNILKS